MSGVTSVDGVGARPHPTFELAHFEHVRATAASALLRLSGRADPESAEVALLVQAGNRRERLSALAAPGSVTGQWAFSAPVEVITDDASWAVEVAGASLPIPSPIERQPPPATPESELARERVARRGAEREVAGLRRRLADMELEVATYQAELEQTRSQVRLLEAESAADRRGLQAEVEDARRELTDQRHELAARADAAEHEMADLRTGGSEPDEPAAETWDPAPS